jgi:hypothetical protein
MLGMQTMLVKGLKPNNGQSTSEYALTIVLVVIVAIVGLSQLGLITSDILGNTITKRKPTLISTAFQAGPNTAFLEAFPDITLKSPSGKTYTLPNYPATAGQFKELIDSTGSDGTERLAAFLKALSDIQDPELLSQEEHDILKKLAQQGFELAKYQKVVEDSTSNNFRVIDPFTAKEQGISAIVALRQINVLNTLSIDRVDAGVNQESRKEYFQKNPELKALVYDAAQKIQASGKASAQKTINIIEDINRLNRGLNSESTTSICDALGCRTLSPEETRQRNQAEYDQYFSSARFQFGSLLEKTKAGSTTICVNSATGAVDPNGKDCV